MPLYPGEKQRRPFVMQNPQNFSREKGGEIKHRDTEMKNQGWKNAIRLSML
jgi:hypothetical protein